MDHRKIGDTVYIRLDRGNEIIDHDLGFLFRILSINGTMIGWVDVSKLKE